MRIAIDIRTAGGAKAGKGWFTFNITRELLRIDTENTYILYADSGIAGFEEFKNAELKVIDKKGLSWHRAVTKDIKKLSIQVFFAPSSFIIPAFLPKPTKSHSIKTIIAIHDLVAFLFPETHDRKATFIEKLFLKRAIKKASAIIAVSENTKKDVTEKFNLPENAIKVIPCAASNNYQPIEASEENTKMFDELRKKTGLPKKFFLAVGTIEPRKNYETLIQAMAMVHERYPNHHLVIVGKKGWQYKQIDDLIHQNYLQKFIHPLGYITSSTLNKLYNLAEAFVFPSYYEGFGIPPLEAMQAGCPVISSHTSSMPEVIGDAGILCDPSQPAEFAQAMERIIKTPSLRTDLINKGRIQSKKFSWHKSAQKLYTLIKTL